MVSPDVQRVAIEDYAAARGYRMVGWLEGLDESGSRARSAWWRKLDQGVTQVEQGSADVLLVWKFSRTARQRLRWAVALDRVEAAGGRLESATEQLDTSTSTGRFARGMLAELNAFEAERIGEVWKEVHSRRVASGRPATGKPKWGYGYDRDAQLHRPDPVTGPVLAELYRRYVAGESVYQLVRWLNGHGHRTLTGGLWSDRTLRRVLDSGFGAGLFSAGGELREGVHEPVIDRELWLRYRDARRVRAGRPARSERSPYLLSGLVRCARCGGPMVAGQFGARREPKYRCARGKASGPEACAGGYVLARFVEGEVLQWLEELAGSVDVAREAAAMAGARRVTAESEQERLVREAGRVEEELRRLALANARAPIPEAVYDQAVAELAGQVGRLRDAAEDAGRQARSARVPPAEVAAGLLETWEGRPVEHRREALRGLLGAVLVRTGRPRAWVLPVPLWECR